MSKPVHQVKDYWPVIGSIWANNTDDGRCYYTFSVQRVYKKHDKDEYGYTNNFRVGEAMELQQTIQDCWKWIKNAADPRTYFVAQQSKSLPGTSPAGLRQQETPPPTDAPDGTNPESEIPF